jgi:energy-coupling factor transporter transmembrane protein EcfT
MQQVPSPKSPRLEVETFKYKLGIILCLYVGFNICISSLPNSLLTSSMPPPSLAHLERVQICIQIVPLLGDNGCFVVTLTLG